MTRSAVLVLVAAVATSGATRALGQQILEPDHEAGRTVIDGPFRAISLPPYLVGIGHSEKAVYVLDLEEPEGGDGILSLNRRTTTGFERVLEFDSHGTLESSWTIHRPNWAQRLRTGRQAGGNR